MKSPAAVKSVLTEVPDEFRDWEGTADDLAKEVAKLLRSRSREERGDSSEVNERLVRHYVTSGVLRPPRRDGRRALFGFVQVAQLILIRRLLAERLSLHQIRDIFATVDWDGLNQQADEILSGLPTSSQSAAVVLIGQLAGQRQFIEPPAARGPSSRVGSAKPEPRLRWLIRPGFEVIADPRLVESLTRHQIDELCEELGASLKLICAQRSKAGV